MIRTNIAIRTLSPEMIDFMYPNYVRTDTYSPFIDGGVIFEGDSKYLQHFRDDGIPYIYVKGTPEYDLTIPENLLNFVFDKWGKKPTKALEDMFRSKDKVTPEFEEIAKIIWVTGKYSIEENVEEKMKSLYSIFARGSTYDIIKEYISLSSKVDPNRLFNNIKWFLKSSQNIDTIRNARAKQSLEDFVASRGKNIKSSLMSYLYSKADNDEIKLLKLFDELTEIRR